MYAIIGTTPGGDGLSPRTKVLDTAPDQASAETKRTERQKATDDWLRDSDPPDYIRAGVYSHITVEEVG